MRLFVGNLPFTTTEADIRALFEQAGEVSRCEVVADRFTGQSRGFAFVEMGSPEGAAQAIQRFSRQQYGQTYANEYARSLELSLGDSLLFTQAALRAKQPAADFGSSDLGTRLRMLASLLHRSLQKTSKASHTTSRMYWQALALVLCLLGMHGRFGRKPLSASITRQFNEPYVLFLSVNPPQAFLETLPRLSPTIPLPKDKEIKQP